MGDGGLRKSRVLCVVKKRILIEMMCDVFKWEHLCESILYRIVRTT